MGILALLAIPAAVLLWRLASGPVAVDFLTPYIAEAFQDSTENSSVEVGATVLQWQGLDRSIDLKARNIRFINLDGDLALALPEVSVKLSVRALLRGVIAPTLIEIHDAYLYLVRQADGTILLEYRSAPPAEGEAPGGKASVALPDFLNQLVPDPDPDLPLTLLNEVRVHSSTVFILDEKLNRIWRMPMSKLELHREAEGLSGDLALSLGNAAAAPTLDAAFIYDKATQTIDLAVSFKDVRPPSLADAFDVLAPLAALDLPLAGSISTSLDTLGNFSDVSFSAEGGAGLLKLPELDIPEVPIRHLALSGRFTADDRKLEIRLARIDVGTAQEAGPSLQFTASLSEDQEVKGRLLADVDLTLEQFAMEDLEGYWPKDMALDARPWVTQNLRSGMVDGLALRTKLAISGGTAMDAVEIETFAGDFTFHDVAVHYMQPLPPATKARGAATFDLDGIKVGFEAAELGALRLDSGAVTISGLLPAEGQVDAHEKILIDLNVRGPAFSALSLLDHEELDLLSDLGIESEGSEGQAKARLTFGFPLTHSLSVDQIKISASSDVEGLVLRKLYMDRDVTEGQVHLEVTNEGMRVTGKADFAGVPFDIDWSEAFEAGRDYRTHLRAVSTRLDEAGRQTLGFDFQDSLKGPIAVTLFLTLQDDGTGEAKIAANLQEATMAIPAISWQKPAGVAGEAHFTVQLSDLTPRSYDSITLKAGDLVAEGRAMPDDSGRAFEIVTLDRLIFPGVELENVILRLTEDPIDIAISGGRINAENFQDGEEEGTAAEPAGPLDPTAFTLRAEQLEAIDFGKERQLHNVSLELEQDDEGWRRIFVYGEIPREFWSPDEAFVFETAKVPPGGLQGRDSNADAPTVESELAVQSQAPQHRQMLIDLAPTSENGRTLKVETNDFGAAMRALDVIDTIRGGQMTLTGKSSGPIGSSRLDARIQANDFFIIDAPVMARLFSIASITGAIELLSQEGLYMRQMVGDFSVEDWVAESELIRVYGNAIGLTAQGSVDIRNDMVDVQGTVVPAYTINRVLGGIPLLGRLLVGGEGEGIFAVTYNVKGSMEAPEISVNPLSVLAPGFLRGLFTGRSDGDEEPRAFPQQLEKRNKLQ